MSMTPRRAQRPAGHLAGAGLLAALALAACARSSHPSPAAGTKDSVEVGYGAQPKDKVMGAVTALSDRDAVSRPMRIDQLLRGKVPGLQIVQGPRGPSFRIRGTGSLLADEEPLIVVDGVMIPSESVSSALAGLMPDDIKGVSVLKDVASTSIYGGRGAGGVILITTKK